MNWQAYISSDSEVCHGKACFKGTRIMVSIVLDNLAMGRSSEEIVESYPALNLIMINAAIGYAAELAREDLIPLSAA